MMGSLIDFFAFADYYQIVVVCIDSYLRASSPDHHIIPVLFVKPEIMRLCKNGISAVIIDLLMRRQVIMRGFRMGRVFAPIFLLFLILPIQAGIALPSFGRHDSSTGFVSDRMLCIFQDRYGLMWFGTNSGLLRYDGISHITYAHDPDDPFSLSNNNVNTIFEDASGNLWIGTSSGLNLINREYGTFAHFHHDPNDPKSIPGDNVWAIAEGKTGEIWVGTDKGLSRFDGVSFKHLDNGLGKPRITALEYDPRGFMWVGTNADGLYRFKAGKAEKIVLGRKVAAQALHVDHCGNLWIGARSKGLARIDHTDQIQWFEHDPNQKNTPIGNTITGLDSDFRGNIWVGTSTGLSRFDPEEVAFTHFVAGDETDGSLSSSSIGALLCGPEGLLWVGTNEGGVDTLDLYNENFVNYHLDQEEVR